MSSTGSTLSEDKDRLRIASIWAAPLVVLFGVSLWLAFSSGGFQPRQWLAPTLALGLFGLVVALLAAYPQYPRQLSLAVLALFGLYAVWVALSAVWAESVTRVWLEATRTGSYLLVLALALVYLTDAGARRAFRYMLIAASFFLLAACLWRLWSANDVASLFIASRFSYPVSYPNNAAALFLIGFWPLMWLAAGPEEKAAVRGLSLGLATGLLGLAVMTQSRGAIWSLGLTVVLTFVVSPARLRTLLYLLVPGLVLVYEFAALNRYWLEGPAVVGGSLGANTLLVASLMASITGTILALLERRIRVSVRMKAVLGGILLVAVVAGATYGSIALTRDVGGPSNWLSHTWRQFTGQIEENESETTSTTRFALVSSSGRADIWRVAWGELRASPVVGVGADNFVFQYDRLRTLENIKPRHAHSIELQVLGETGFVGGILAFGGMLLALGGIMWPRCAAGWLGMREKWPRRREGSDSSPTRSRFCNPRWGSNSTSYGWEMALLAGVAYWLVHASVDWLWQMAGVTIPALLLLAAALASTDARAGIMWPRWNRWLGMKPSSSGTDDDTSGQRHSDPVRPSGIVSPVFRALMVTLSLVVIISSGLLFLSLQYQRSALALAKTDGARAVERAASASWFQPADPGPHATRARIYANAAEAAVASGDTERAGAVLDNLSLSIASYEDAIAKEPADWSLRYQAGVTTLDMILASEYASGRDPDLDYVLLIPLVPGLEDWSALAGSLSPLPAPGVAAGSLAASTDSQGTAAKYRNLSNEELANLALGFLNSAKKRNPLAAQVGEAIGIAERVLGD